jgi:hypothetical protein
VKRVLNPATNRWLVLAACAMVSMGFWRWAKLVLVPAYNAQVAAAGRPTGNNSDLYPRWLGSRELLLHGRDPYGAEMTREIQTGFYGRPLNPQNPSDPKAQESFVYPVYVAFLLAPTVSLPFATVAAIFRWLLLIAIAFSVPLWTFAVGLHRSVPIVLCATLLAVSSYPALEEYSQQNLTALVIFFLAAASAATVRNWLALAGFLLALATVKPDITGPMVLWFLLWAAAAWKQRSPLIWSFAGTMAVLLVGAEAVSPHWIARFASAIREYPAYGADPSILQVLMPSFLARLAEALVIITSTIVCWRWKAAEPGSNHFGASLAWVGSATLICIPKLAAYNQLLLIPALLVLVARYGSNEAIGIIPRALVKSAFACQSWQWLSAAALCLVSFVTPPERLRVVAQAPLYTLLALPPITFLAILFLTFSSQGKEWRIPTKGSPRVKQA